jgi:DNA gyrase inhibitor GyrI
MANEPGIVPRAEQRYVGINRFVTMQTLAEVADTIPVILGWLAARGVEPAGAPFFRYHAIDMERELEVEAGVPVPPGSAIPASDDEVTGGVLPAGRYVTVTHVGPPDELVHATADLLNWADKQGLRFDREPGERGERWGARLEFYETDPAVEPDMTKWHTTLAFRLAD